MVFLFRRRLQGVSGPWEVAPLGPSNESATRQRGVLSFEVKVEGRQSGIGAQSLSSPLSLESGASPIITSNSGTFALIRHLKDSI